MERFRRLSRWLLIRSSQPEILRGQYRELQRQVPFLYALLNVNAAAVAYTHYGLAPFWLCVAVPVVLALACTVRFAVWMRRRDHVPATDIVLHQLRITTLLAGIIAGTFITWSLFLAGYGGPNENAHIAIFCGITVIGCIFCLMHLPQAALVVTATVMTPYLAYWLSQGNMVYIAVALNIILVSAVMLQVLANSFRSFAALVLTQAETERLSGDNLRLAHTDALTGLPNRRFFFAKLAERLAAPDKRNEPFAIGVIDLDRFKPVNDTHGHAVGDCLLERLGQRLAALEGAFVVARLGGDEFGFLLEGGDADAERFGDALCAAISEPYQIDNLRLLVGSSCGIAVYPAAGDTDHALFDRADYALYNAKTSRRGRATLYSKNHETNIRFRHSIEAALLAADVDAEMSLHLQPILDGRTGRVTMVEVLARWTSPTLGAVRPDLFIAGAERLGIINRLTLVLFRKALDELERLPAEISLSFNLSAHDVTSPQTMLALVAAIRQSKADTGRLIFEVTETAMMRDFDLAAGSLRLLRSMGVRIALDDFGTGYSSLGHLHRLTLDKVKVDRSFVARIGEQQGRDLMTAVIALCRSLHLECVVEGVETPEQDAILRELGTVHQQGYLHAPPMPSQHFPEWLAQREQPADNHAALPRSAGHS